jgi:hypothetical protein
VGILAKQPVRDRISVIGALLGIVFAASGVVEIHANAARPFDVWIRLQVDRAIAPRINSHDLEEEAESLWTPYGVRLNWVDPGESDERADGFSVQAALNRRIDGPRQPEWASVLGRTSVRLEPLERGPIVLSFDATEKLLDFRKITGPSSVRIVRDQEMARALGRVLAHEIGHVLLAAPYHDAVGLMRPSFNPGDLAARPRQPFRLTCTSVERLRSRVRVLTRVPAVEPFPEDDPFEQNNFDTAVLMEGQRSNEPTCIRAPSNR